MEIGEIIERAGGPAQLGRIVGRDRTTVRAWKQVPTQHLKAVSRALGVPVEQLLPASTEQDRAA